MKTIINWCVGIGLLTLSMMDGQSQSYVSPSDVVLPEVKFLNESLPDAIEELSKLAKTHNQGRPQSREKLGYQITTFKDSASFLPPRISYSAKNVKVEEAIEEMCFRAQALVRWGRRGVTITLFPLEEYFAEWKNVEGVVIDAVFLHLEKDTVFFKLRNKKTVPYPLSKLSEESRKAIETLMKDRRERFEKWKTD